MSIENRLQRLEQLTRLSNLDVSALSDQELERLINSGPPEVNRWLRGLTDDELETVASARPGCSAILATAPKEFFR